MAVVRFGVVRNIDVLHSPRAGIQSRIVFHDEPDQRERLAVDERLLCAVESRLVALELEAIEDMSLDKTFAYRVTFFGKMHLRASSKKTCFTSGFFGGNIVVYVQTPFRFWQSG